jgi:TolB-like protein/tetratricopeptide (TPR) repeat protein
MNEPLDASKSADLSLGYDYQTSLPRIAVFPFCDDAGSGDQRFFCEGIAAEILICLARTPGLQVVARSAVSALLESEGRNVDLALAGKKLNAKAILRGRVVTTSDSLKMAVALVATATGERLWSDTFERDVSEVFAILDEIVPQIMLAVHVKPAEDMVRNIQSIHTGNLKAYEFYLRGRQLYWSYSRQSVESAADMFEKAIELDPLYTLAFSGLADCYSYQYMYVEPSRDHLRKAEEASKRALELDPGLAEAHASRGVVLSLANEVEQAERAFERAIELDPLLFDAHLLFARFLFAEGQFERAVQAYLEANRTRPEDYQSLLLAAVVVETLGDTTHAKELRRRGVDIVEKLLSLGADEPRALYMGANGLVGLGETEKAIEWLEKARERESEDPMLLYNAACIYALTGRGDEAVDCLKRAVKGGLRQKGWFDHDSDLDSIRSHPGFVTLRDELV